jgi:hypothetical protein
MYPAMLLLAASWVCPVPQPENLTAKKGDGESVTTWCRDAGPVHLSIQFKEDRLIGTAFYDCGDDSVKVTIDADVTVAKDGTVYGYITGIDAGPGCLATTLQSFAGQPFVFKTRTTNDVFSISEVKFAGVGIKMPGEQPYAGVKLPSVSQGNLVSTAPIGSGMDLGAALNAIGGRYKPDDGTWKPTGKTPAKTSMTFSFGPVPVMVVGGAEKPGKPVEMPAQLPPPTVAPENFVPSTVPPTVPAPTMPFLPKKEIKFTPPPPRTNADILTAPPGKR